jgi:hypothetical protein
MRRGRGDGRSSGGGEGEAAAAKGNPRVGEGNCPEGSLTLPLYTHTPLRPDNSAKFSSDYPASPDIPPMGADILAWEARN